MTASDDLLFRDDEELFGDDEWPAESGVPSTEPWKVLVVDDEEEVHRATRLVLEDFTFDGRGLEFYYAESAAEGLKKLRQHPDTAVILLDVVMETTEAGLEMVRNIRHELNNRLVRIILRTGQPGQAPEQSVIVEYDINDYKEKSELTAQRLFTSMTVALRTHRDMLILDRNRLGLQQIIEASYDLFGMRSIRQLAMGVLNQLTGTLGMGGDALFLQARQPAESYADAEYSIVAGTGKFAHCTEHVEERYICLEHGISDIVNEAIERRKSIMRGDLYVGVFPSSGDVLNMVYLECKGGCASSVDDRLIGLFSRNVSVAVNNVRLNDELVQTKQDVVQRLGEALERREHRAGRHVRRVSEMAALLGRLVGMGEGEVERLRLATPMHDVGKVGIPDAILGKPGPLSEQERAVAQEHSVIGYNLLGGAAESLQGDAAIIAGQHHENWDGSGYPEGLSGEQIHMFARIVALCDVFDTVLHDRVYAEPWSVEDAVAYILKNRGVSFDPSLVDLFRDNLQDFQEIQRLYPDS